ncbi:MAG: hypothetical protein IPK79_08260 [Vampirovibrionales bacterium]|nr:hypothetical protein [Vampirovibrionales bacterium]
MDFRIESSPPPRLDTGAPPAVASSKATRASLTPLQKLAGVQPSGATGVEAISPAIQPATRAPSVNAAASDKLFFSSQSTRAQVERFVQDKTLPGGLAFEFVPTQSPARRWIFPQRLTALAAYRRQSRKRVASDDERNGRQNSGKKRRGKASKRAKQDSEPLPLAHVRLYRLEYAPVMRPPLLIEALKLDFDKLPAPEDAAKPNVMLTRDGALIPHRQFRRQGVTQRPRPRVEKIVQALRGALPGGALSRFLQIDPKGTVRLFEQFSFNPTFQWEDAQGSPLRAYHLERLPNGVIAEIFVKERLGEFEGALRDPALRKRLREKILAEVERMEAQGLTLKTTPSLAPVGVLSAGQIARVSQEGASKNPFMKLSAHFQAQRSRTAAVTTTSDVTPVLDAPVSTPSESSDNREAARTEALPAP